MKNTLILNEGTVPPTTEDIDIAAKLRNDMNRLKENLRPRTGKVDYRAMQSSEAYRNTSRTPVTAEFRSVRLVFA
jgi:hypothetical protein